MKTILKVLCAVMLGLGAGSFGMLAQTDGSAKLDVTILNYVGRTGTAHWTVAWVTTESGTFIKTLWRQGPMSFTSHYADHLGVWNTARAGSTALDGYTTVTAPNYNPTNNNPVAPAWNCRDASNALVPDGNYKFWVQYAEDSGQGPYTTSGLLWTKGPAAATTTYANQGANFSNMRVIWTPAAVTVPPTITSAPPPATGTVGTAYNFTVTATGTPSPTFTAPGLPTGVTISPAGVISGTPTTAGTFPGTITASNGVGSDATQNFTIVISLAPVAPTITSAPPPATGTVGTAYNFTVTATGTPAPTFTAPGLPTGLTISSAGVISGTPTTAGTFPGTITASNGVNPDATQAFSIVISLAPVAPTITSQPAPATGTVGTAYNFTVTATGTPAPTFTAPGLPTGLTISSAGVISGTPTTAGTFTGTITASNGVNPDATQAFSIVISDVPPVTIVSVRTEGSNLVLSGTGPANATYHVLSSSDLALPTAQWTSVATNSIDSSGNFSVTIPTSAGVSRSFTKLRVP